MAIENIPGQSGVSGAQVAEALAHGIMKITGKRVDPATIKVKIMGFGGVAGDDVCENDRVIVLGNVVDRRSGRKAAAKTSLAVAKRKLVAPKSDAKTETLPKSAA